VTSTRAVRARGPARAGVTGTRGLRTPLGNTTAHQGLCPLVVFGALLIHQSLLVLFLEWRSKRQEELT